MQPTLEDRVESLEQRTSRTEAGIIKISKDIKKLDDGIKASYAAIGDALNEGFDNVATIKATMATKDDISALKDDISRIETRLDSHEDLLRQILERLPPKQ
jgi:ubiquinone biosynthesis protein UbiJ